MRRICCWMIFVVSSMAMTMTCASSSETLPGDVDFKSGLWIFDANGGLGRLKPGIDIRAADLRVGRPSGKVYFYRDAGDKKWTLLDPSIEGLNLFITRAVDTSDSMVFMERYLPKLLLKTAAPQGSEIVDQALIELYDRLLRTYGNSLADDLQHAQAELDKLKSTSISSAPTMSANQWKMAANIVTVRGGIEHWEVEGTVSPLAITDFKRNSLRPSGWYKSFVE